MSRTAVKVVIGTRGSRLALRQSEIVLSQLKRLFPEVPFELKTIRTGGDKRPTETPLATEAIGFFTKELEEALLAGQIDLAVHSLKDLPIKVPEGLGIAAVTERANPQDVLVTPKGRSLDALSRGSRIGTGSPRRKAQLLYARPDLEIVPIRGNVETRIQKIASQGFEGIILAACGLFRAGVEDAKRWLIPFETMLPAPGQGALAVEIRSDDEDIRKIVNGLDHLPSRLATVAERAFHASLGGGCQLPLGALATVEGETLRLEGVLLDPQGRKRIRLSIEGSKEKAEEIGTLLGKRLKEEGAEELLYVSR